MRGCGLGQPEAGNAQFLVRILLKSNEDVVWDSRTRNAQFIIRTELKRNEDLMLDSRDQEMHSS